MIIYERRYKPNKKTSYLDYSEGCVYGRKDRTETGQC